MSNMAWDGDYNEGTMTEEQRTTQAAAQFATMLHHREQQRLLMGYTTIPAISTEVLMTNFAVLQGDDQDAQEMRLSAGRESITLPWHANKLMWICHDCGMFGFKYSIRETFKCYAWRCRSRNVTVCRAGELSMLIRGIVPSAGVNMQDLYAQRQERIRANRRGENVRSTQPESGSEIFATTDSIQ